MAWWQRNNLRLIQNNLRESDANLDVDKLIAQLKKLSVNVLMMNAGGIVAFYPTKLENQYRASGQRKDLLKEAIEKAHANGMKFIARFDFSKAHEQIFARHPEWFYRTKDGREVNYHGIVHTCVNGYYQREYSLKIIHEVISQYDVDGIFFNMFGYTTRDYSLKDYGLCHCDNCKQRFREWYGEELPENTSPDNPVYRKYREFQDRTTKLMLDNIHELVKSTNKDIAISTYSEHKVDIVRKESNTDIQRPHPVWLYSASENVKSLEDSWEDKLVSNCCINAISLTHRFTGVSKQEVNIRLKEGMASGSGLDFCIIGVFEDYPDNANLQTVEDIFRYHQEYERYYGNFISVADIALVKPASLMRKNEKEYRGLFKILKEQHLLFDVIDQATLEGNKDRLLPYKMILIPDIPHFTENELQVLEELHQQGVQLLATGQSFTGDEANLAALQRIFGVTPVENKHYVQTAAYLKIEDKQVFSSFPDRDWIILDGQFQHAAYEAGTTAVQLPLVSPSTFGPPERAFGHRMSSDYGAGIRRDQGRTATYVPWTPGELYYKHGYVDHKDIVIDLVSHLLPGRRQLVTNAPEQVELFFNKLDDQTYILHLLNLSGFNGVSYFEPAPVHGIEVTIHDIGPVKGIESLTNEAAYIKNTNQQDLSIRLDTLADFAAVIIHI